MNFPLMRRNISRLPHWRKTRPSERHNKEILGKLESFSWTSERNSCRTERITRIPLSLRGSDQIRHYLSAMILTDENVGYRRGSTRKSITKSNRTDLRRGSGNHGSIWKSPSARRRKFRRLLKKKCACDCVSGRGLSDWEHSRLRLSHPTVSSTPSPTRLIPLMLSPPPWSSEAPRPHTPDTSSTVRRQRQRPCALGSSAKRGTSDRPFGTRHLEFCSLSLGVHPWIYSMFSTCHAYPRQHLFLFFPEFNPSLQLAAKHLSRTESHGSA